MLWRQRLMESALETTRSPVRLQRQTIVETQLLRHRRLPLLTQQLQSLQSQRITLRSVQTRIRWTMLLRRTTVERLRQMLWRRRPMALVLETTRSPVRLLRRTIVETQLLRLRRLQLQIQRLLSLRSQRITPRSVQMLIRWTTLLQQTTVEK